MAETPNRVTVHCPGCSEAMDVPIHVGSITRAPDLLLVRPDPSTVRHVCKVMPYVDGSDQRPAGRAQLGPAGQLEVTGR